MDNSQMKTVVLKKVQMFNIYQKANLALLQTLESTLVVMLQKIFCPKKKSYIILMQKNVEQKINRPIPWIWQMRNGCNSKFLQRKTVTWKKKKFQILILMISRCPCLLFNKIWLLSDFLNSFLMMTSLHLLSTCPICMQI